ncbi:MAG TPA: hypothetical protein VK211_29180 [Kamptonema sp.]|nr:hypothetical protein [Kamptonema sp.]
MKKNYLVTYDRTANLQGAIEGDGEILGKDWPSHKRGKQIRDRIMELKQKNPNLSIEQIANHCKISTDQAKRHRTNLIASGLWKIWGCAIALGASFIAGAYYADAEVVDEWIESRVKSPILSMQDEILWNWEQRKFL